MFGFMHTEPIITTERVDDIPLLLTQLERKGVKQLLDKHFPTHCTSWVVLFQGTKDIYE